MTLSTSFAPNRSFSHCLIGTSQQPSYVDTNITLNYKWGNWALERLKSLAHIGQLPERTLPKGQPCLLLVSQTPASHSSQVQRGSGCTPLNRCSEWNSKGHKWSRGPQGFWSLPLSIPTAGLLPLTYHIPIHSFPLASPISLTFLLWGLWVCRVPLRPGMLKPHVFTGSFLNFGNQRKSHLRKEQPSLTIHKMTHHLCYMNLFPSYNF